MKRFFFTVATILLIASAASAQKVYTKNGLISFFSKTALENIKADNNQVLSVLNTQTGELQFSVLTKGFHFPKAMMEEHFNAEYMESSKYPKSTFKGTVADIAAINFTKDGSYPVTVRGDLNIHGVTKSISSTGTINIKTGKINVSSKFIVSPADYNISIPKVYKENIAKSIEITVNCNLDQKI